MGSRVSSHAIRGSADVVANVAFVGHVVAARHALAALHAGFAVLKKELGQFSDEHLARFATIGAGAQLASISMRKSLASAWVSNCLRCRWCQFR